jgi:NADP-dependent 3-hydroxy acid dehydrogenase YdfG
MVTLEDKIVLITGAASGLGAATAKVMLANGAKVALVDRQADKLEATRQELDPHGERTLALTFDICDQNAVQQGINQIIDRFGGLDVLVNNAGTDKTLPIEELTVEDWERVIATNLTAPFVLSKLALPALRKSRGQIVNIASTAARRCWPNASAYHASKFGLVGLSHALHAELRPHQIRVTTVIVGGMKTPFLLDRFEGLDLTKLQDPANVAEAVRMALTMPAESVIPEIMVLPREETSWP